ncbi:MAG: SET domain-containing protein-lysine N-methyltransferase [Candidatus Peribacteraceae bacterium]|nr:SET domain-containing protein-lysine N-methyltransferase [Candidatus Peribacteraceae bacterium]
MFSDKPIRKGEIVEVCPAIIISHEEAERCRETLLYEYLFDWGEHGGPECLPCGFGLLYNHSSDPNIEWDTRSGDETIIFTALKDIPADEELCHDYWPGQTIPFDSNGCWRARMEKGTQS